MRETLINLITPNKNEPKNYIKIFLLSGIVASLIFLPFIIFDKGLFLLYGDYNVQQIPFYQLAHDAVRSGSFGWNWHTDLGANFIASYSFYLLGSPFFWLTIPFPNEMLPYLMAPLFILKFSIAALTSYIFIRRFTKTAYMAFFGALMYAFSGFMIYNIFYNHFHEVVAFFPLMLIGMEELMVNKRKGLFALTVALNLITSYYFFVPAVVFLVIYFIIRCLTGKFKLKINFIVCIFIESILGVMMGIILFIPSALMVMQNPRVGGMLLGYDMLFYDTPQKYGLIIQSLFFPPDMPAFPNFFPDADAKWFSVAAYLPMFSMIGVISFIKEKRKSWLKYILIALFIAMFVPILNSVFNGLNSSFYTRWFYILTLMTALATAISLERKNIDISSGIKLNLIIVGCFALIGILPKKENNAISFFQMPEHPIMFWINVLLTVAGIIITYMLTKKSKKGTKQFYKNSILALCTFIFIYSTAQITWGKCYGGLDAYKNVVEDGLNTRFDLDKTDFYRIDLYGENNTDNWPMYWKEPSIQAFQSTVPASIMTFYKNIDIKRDVASRPDTDKYDALRHFLSVKYIFIREGETSNIPAGFKFDSNQNGFNIYKNEYFMPIGFAMDKYIKDNTWQHTNSLYKDRLLLKGVLLNENQIKKYETILSPVSIENSNKLTDNQMISDIKALKSKECTNFKYNSYGFTANISLHNDNLVLFTVPYESDWTATVNNNPVDIENVDSGMMAVKCNKGDNNIVFKYKTPGLTESIFITIIGAIIYIIYMLINKKMYKNNPSKYKPINYGQKLELESDEKTPTNSDIENFYKQSKN